VPKDKETRTALWSRQGNIATLISSFLRIDVAVTFHVATRMNSEEVRRLIGNCQAVIFYQVSFSRFFLLLFCRAFFLSFSRNVIN
jgi:hypothetical protein